MPRAKAQRLLEELLDRVRAENDDPAGLYWIEWVELYGSFAEPDREQVGDIDVRIFAIGRYPHDEQFEREKAFAADSGRSFGSLIDYLGTPRWSCADASGIDRASSTFTSTSATCTPYPKARQWCGSTSVRLRTRADRR